MYRNKAAGYRWLFLNLFFVPALMYLCSRKGVRMKNITILVFQLLILALPFILPSQAFAASGEISKIQTFIQSIIQVLVTLSGLTAAAFFVFGGFKYITSSGDPESLDKSKKTILYSAVGLTIVLAAFVLSTAVTELATAAFGSGTPTTTP